MEERITAILKSIGLNKNEVKIYLDLIRQEYSTALEISRRTGIHRSNTYDSIGTLIEKGFVNERMEGAKKVFQAVDPIKIREYLGQKQQDLESIIPFLRQFSSSGERSESVSLSKGLFALKSILMGLLAFDSPIEVYGISKVYLETLGSGFLNEFHNQRQGRNISIRKIYNMEAYFEDSPWINSDGAQIRHLSKKYDSLATTHICADKVVIVVFGKIPFIIEINSSEIAESYRTYFEILWNHSRFE